MRSRRPSQLLGFDRLSTVQWDTCPRRQNLPDSVQWLEPDGSRLLRVVHPVRQAPQGRGGPWPMIHLQRWLSENLGSPFAFGWSSNGTSRDEHARRPDQGRPQEFCSTKPTRPPIHAGPSLLGPDRCSLKKKPHVEPCALQRDQIEALLVHEEHADVRLQPIQTRRVEGRPERASFECRHHLEPEFGPPQEGLGHAGSAQETIRPVPKPEESRDGGLGIRPVPNLLWSRPNHQISNVCSLERIAKKSSWAVRATPSPPHGQDLVFLGLKLLRNAASESNHREWHHQNPGGRPKQLWRLRTTDGLAELPHSSPNTLSFLGRFAVLGSCPQWL